MKVKDLIKRLSKFEEDSEVKFFISFENIETIDEITEYSDGCVILGYELPPEAYGKDYKYD